MKLKDYMKYLKFLHDRYGDDTDVQVKIRITHDVYGGEGMFETDEEYIKFA